MKGADPATTNSKQSITGIFQGCVDVGTFFLLVHLMALPPCIRAKNPDVLTTYVLTAEALPRCVTTLILSLPQPPA